MTAWIIEWIFRDQALLGGTGRPGGRGHGRPSRWFVGSPVLEAPFLTHSHLEAGLSGVVCGLVVDLFGMPALPPIAALLSLGSLGLLALALRQEPARPSGA